VSSTAPLTKRSPWIISPGWDLSYIVVTPLLIVPVVLMLARRWLTPEQVSLAVIAFASLGHHLPGFMRAYGDRELFRRYPLRFVLAPPLALGLALLFTPPTALATALKLPWTHLHGLELILLVWGTWHGLMQTYGFMRIYDVRLGVDDRWTARLDHALCLSVFLGGVVFSDARVFGIADAMWQTGLPPFGPQWLRGARWTVGLLGGATLLAYALNQLRLRRQGIPLSGIKLLLIGTTGWFYWYTGRLSTNVLIGLAMFEIYHAVQYCAIVWIYNRRLLTRAGDRFGPLGFLFRDRWTMLGIYLAAIAAYSSIRYFTVDANAYLFQGGDQNTHQWLIALFVTSSLLHFYFDGFIWKVSQKQTQQNLVEDELSTPLREHYVPAALHAGKWLLLLAIAAGLLLAERRQSSQQRETARLAALAALTPELPECQALLGRAALSRGQAQVAIEHASRALALRPRSHTLHADLGLAYLMAGDLDPAIASLRQAVALAPDQWAYASDLGLALARQGKTAQAELALRHAVELAPTVETPRQLLAEFYLQQGNEAAAAIELTEIAQRFPASLTGEIGKVVMLMQQNRLSEAVQLASFLAIGNPQQWRVQLTLGAALNASHEPEAALDALQKARQLRPQSAEIHTQLGLAELQRGQALAAIQSLLHATRLDPENFRAHFLLGNAYYSLKKWDQALETYTYCQTMQPNHPELCANLGGLLAQQGQREAAEKIYRAGLEVHPDSGQLHYNLGVLLWQTASPQEARQQLQQAEQLGIKLPSAVRQAIDAE
jgi:Flp pilus assembly protein TadD